MVVLATGKPVSVIGTVAGPPVGRVGGDAFLLKTQWVRVPGGEARAVRGRVWVFRKSVGPWLGWGDRVSLWGPLFPVEEGSRFPGGATTRLFVPPGKSGVLERASIFSPFRWATVLKGAALRSFRTWLSPVSADLMAGVVLGDRPLGLSAFAEDFRRSGLYHLLVASGSNVGFALAVWWMLSRWVLWWPRRWTLVVAPFWAFLYALVAGGDPPVLRAALMASSVCWGALIGRWDRLEQPLFLSAGILILWRPAILFEAGFQMSYTATLAVVVVAQHLQQFPQTHRAGIFRGFLASLLRGAQGLFWTSLGAQIALLPLLLHYFGRISWPGFLSNMLAVPLAGVCLFMGTGLTVLSGWSWAAALWAVPTQWVAGALVRWAQFCASWPHAELAGTLSTDQTLVLYGGLVVSVFFIRNHWKKSLPIFWAGTLLILWGLKPAKVPVPFDVHWTGGPRGCVVVRTTESVTLFDYGDGARCLKNLNKKKEIRRFDLTQNTDAVKKWAGDGRVWTEGVARWETFCPLNGDGVAVRLSTGDLSVLLNFGLTKKQQADLLRQGGKAVDLVGWAGGKGGPPTDDLLARLTPRWIVYRGTRLPRTVRRAEDGAEVRRPSRVGLWWAADPRPLAPRDGANW